MPPFGLGRRTANGQSYDQPKTSVSASVHGNLPEFDTRCRWVVTAGQVREMMFIECPLLLSTPFQNQWGDTDNWYDWISPNPGSPGALTSEALLPMTAAQAIDAIVAEYAPDDPPWDKIFDRHQQLYYDDSASNNNFYFGYSFFFKESLLEFSRHRNPNAELTWARFLYLATPGNFTESGSRVAHWHGGARSQVFVLRLFGNRQLQSFPISTPIAAGLPLNAGNQSYSIDLLVNCARQCTSPLFTVRVRLEVAGGASDLTTHAFTSEEYGYKFYVELVTSSGQVVRSVCDPLRTDPGEMIVKVRVTDSGVQVQLEFFGLPFSASDLLQLPEGPQSPINCHVFPTLPHGKTLEDRDNSYSGVHVESIGDMVVGVKHRALSRLKTTRTIIGIKNGTQKKISEGAPEGSNIRNDFFLLQGRLNVDDTAGLANFAVLVDPQQGADFETMEVPLLPGIPADISLYDAALSVQTSTNTYFADENSHQQMNTYGRESAPWAIASTCEMYESSRHFSCATDNQEFTRLRLHIVRNPVPLNNLGDPVRFEPDHPIDIELTSEGMMQNCYIHHGDPSAAVRFGWSGFRVSPLSSNSLANQDQWVSTFEMSLAATGEAPWAGVHRYRANRRLNRAEGISLRNGETVRFSIGTYIWRQPDVEYVGLFSWTDQDEYVEIQLLP